ncbi:MAG: hypothetical protein B6229_10610, partial [Spirochaetaceae bacterium 4572_7]
MSNQLVIVMAIKLVIGFMAAFTSVMLWSKTRDGAWLSMVLGVVFLYLETLLEILDSFGFIIYKSFNFGEIEIRLITWKEALDIRHEVLWPSKDPLFCKVDGDETGTHYGGFVNNRLISVASVYID